MTNLIRTLIWNDEVSLTLIDGTKLCKRGEEIHGLYGVTDEIFAESLLFTAFLSACLKNDRGGVSLSVRGERGIKDITVSGNKRLEIRGSIETENAEQGVVLDSFTVIRDDGYSRPFVGTLAAVEGDMDAQFEEYFRLSEQLPTFFKSVTEFDENGKIIFAGMVVLQPLPFATEENLARCKDEAFLFRAVETLQKAGVKGCVEELFGSENLRMEERFSAYKCNCSREYLAGVLVSVGKDELLKIVAEEGSVKIHCHYCDTDYEFNENDVENMFSNK